MTDSDIIKLRQEISTLKREYDAAVKVCQGLQARIVTAEYRLKNHPAYEPPKARWEIETPKASLKLHKPPKKMHTAEDLADFN